MKNVCELMKMFLVPSILLRRDRQDFRHSAASLSTVPPSMPVASITAFGSSVKCFLGSTLIMLLAFNEYQTMQLHVERAGSVVIPRLR